MGLCVWGIGGFYGVGSFVEKSTEKVFDILSLQMVEGSSFQKK